MDQQIQSHNIQVTPDEVSAYMLDDPPDYFKAGFMVDGQFDDFAYYTALKNNPEYRDHVYEVCQSYLPKKKLQDLIAKESGITPDSIRAEYIKTHTSITGKAIWFDHNSTETEAVTDKEIEERYQKNKENLYKFGSGSKIRYVCLDLKPSTQDLRESKSEIDRIYRMLEEGDLDFREIATRYSEDPGSASQGGRLGAFTLGQMVKEFEDVIFNLEEGEVSEPFQTQFGWHIARCDRIISTTPGWEQIEGSHILIRDKISPSTERELVDSISDLRSLSLAVGLEAAARQTGLDIKESGWLDLSKSHLPDFGQNEGLLTFLRDSPLGTISNVFRVIANGNYALLVAQLTDRQNVCYFDLADKRDEIAQLLLQEKKIAQTLPLAKYFCAQNQPADYFGSAPQWGFQVIDLNDFKSGTYLPLINVHDPQFEQKALALEKGAYSPPFTTENGVFLIYAQNVQKPDLSVLAKDPDLQDQIRKQLADWAYSRWFTALLRQAKIIDKRVEMLP